MEVVGRSTGYAIGSMAILSESDSWAIIRVGADRRPRYHQSHFPSHASHAVNILSLPLLPRLLNIPTHASRVRSILSSRLLATRVFANHTSSDLAALLFYHSRREVLMIGAVP